MSSPSDADIPASPDAYAAWVNQRIGQEVIRRRTAIGLSAETVSRNDCYFDPASAVASVARKARSPLLNQ